MRPADRHLEAGLGQPHDQVGERVGAVESGRQLDRHIRRIDRNDHVGEHEPPARRQRLADPSEQTTLLGRRQVVHGQRAGHQVERPVGQLVLEPGDDQRDPVGGQPRPRDRQHLVGLVDPDQRRVGMAGQQPPRGLPRPGAEFQDPSRDRRRWPARAAPGAGRRPGSRPRIIAS